MNLKAAFDVFLAPPREFGPMPFWFWNDDLEEEELLRQLGEFRAAHFGGFVLHPRVGLSRRIGYLTDEYFRLVRRVVDEAARLDMKAILYDEGSYPSGSAQGAVAAENADYASQAMGLWEREVEGPFSGFWRPNTGRALLDRHVCTAAGQVQDGRIDPQSVRLLEVMPNDVVRIDVPAGRWQVMSVWNAASGGHIRGVFPEEESGSMMAPAAGDILNPDAVACFLRLTHDRYYEHLKEHFGTTIIAMFTDEPSFFGKSPQRPKNPFPYTPGLIEWLQQHWGEDPRPWLPALWRDYGEGTDEFRRKFATAIQARLHEVFYSAQSRWCAEHGIALTGHPAGSNEMSALRFFQLPGQDMVGRWVVPNDASGIEGKNSVAPKAATSGARMQGARRILTEVCGAYGWRLTLDEMKWLYDWHLVRGNNLIDPHAVFYSIRGRRAWESEPDVFLHNTWRPYTGAINLYVQRLSWLLCDGAQMCEVAVLGDGNALPWAAAKQLYQNQIDFLYLDEQAVAEATVEGGVLKVGEQQYRVVVVDGDPVLSAEARGVLEVFEQEGGRVLEFAEDMDLPARLDKWIDRDLRLEPGHPDLRFIHYCKDGLDFYLLCNEGGEAIKGDVWLNLIGQVECWDALAGARREMPRRAAQGGVEVELELGRRESMVLVVDKSVEFSPAVLDSYEEERLAVEVEWEVRRVEGETLDGLTIGDWAQCAGLELFSGTLCYRAEIDIPQEVDAVGLDLGAVGDIAEVLIDGERCGVRMWAPYEVWLGRLASGRHRLEVRATNTMANAYEGVQSPSGLMGPVRLVLRRRR